ncbi:cytochrome C [Methylacidimicrobium sp. B4]|uniref:cytochrome C n=1 Tax=Methylacidimicrobium sp. B4 TaxID=2796139 RepID=UPI001A8CEDD5|nr:cytochrome C [Methylacidimicrobium sp. B4]QSR84886.1 cytochrome C [Methylacidimicrobium sp. B4]
MNPYRFMAAASALLLWSLSGSTGSALADPDGLSEAGVYALDSSGLLLPTSPYPGNTSSAYSVGAYPLAPTPLARGTGQELVESYCSICHSVTLIGAQPPFPPELWKKEVDKMIHLGAPIPTDLAGQIVDYLQKHYSPVKMQPSAPEPGPKPSP